MKRSSAAQMRQRSNEGGSEGEMDNQIRKYTHLGVVFLDPGDACELEKSAHGVWVVPKGILVRRLCALEIAHLFRDGACRV
jgi:hypothetical protein